MTPRMFVAGLVSNRRQRRSPRTSASGGVPPGSELFVVYSDAHDTAALSGGESLQNRGLVIKVNKLLRF
jgi:hypothetical protein